MVLTALLLTTASVRGEATLGSDVAPLIEEVRVEGNRRVEPEAIKRALINKEKKPYDALRTGDDLRALWALNYFADIQLLLQRLPSGAVAYVVRVTERPSIREVKLEGNDELSKEDFKESLDTKPFAILDLAALKRTAKKMQDKYVEKGFFLAEVKPEVIPVEGQTEVDVVYRVREYAKVAVKEINIIGADKVPAADVKAVMATRESGLLSFLTGEGTYREEMFQRDQSAILAVYYDRGFINARVDKPHVSISPDKRHISISLHVEEGDPFTIGKIDFSGDMLLSKEEMAPKMTAKVNDIFSRTALAKDIQTVTDLFYDRGYAYANIVPVTAIDPAKRTIDITYDVQKGKQVTIERIELVGNTKTRDQVIRRQLRVYEGELFSGSDMRRSKDRVTALGFFETVEVSHKPGSDDSHVVVQVEIKEKSTGTFNVGFGFSNYETFIFTAQVNQNNMLGWGVSVSASASLSPLRQFLQLSYYDLYFLDTDFIFSLDAYRTQFLFGSFNREATGGSIGIGRHLIEDWIVNVGYSGEYVNVEANQNADQGIPYNGLFRSGFKSVAKLSTTVDRRNNRLFPTDGWMVSGSVEFAPRFLGSDFNFINYSAYGRYYQPLPLGIVLKGNLTVGYIQGLDAKRGLPPSELFYLGGINSVRGYLLRTISPSTAVVSRASPDATNTTTPFTIGGDKQIYLNVELEFPIIEKVGIRGVLFYDAGNSFAPGASFFEDKRYNLPLGLFHSVGFGVRWFSPIGPLRFEWGIPLNKRLDFQDQPIAFEFTIGNFF